MENLSQGEGSWIMISSVAAMMGDGIVSACMSRDVQKWFLRDARTRLMLVV